MRRIILGGVAAIGAFLAIRKIAEIAGPALRKRGMEMCDQVLANMPESFPPNRMMADLDSIKEKTARIQELIEDRQVI